MGTVKANFPNLSTLNSAYSTISAIIEDGALTNALYWTGVAWGNFGNVLSYGGSPSILTNTQWVGTIYNGDQVNATGSGFQSENWNVYYLDYVFDNSKAVELFGSVSFTSSSASGAVSHVEYRNGQTEVIIDGSSNVADNSARLQKWSVIANDTWGLELGRISYYGNVQASAKISGGNVYFDYSGPITRITATYQGHSYDITNVSWDINTLPDTNSAEQFLTWAQAGSDTVSGTAGNEVLYGFGGDDWLDGRAGSDLLVGGPGNDTYVADSGDTVSELAGEGVDTMRVDFSLTLPDNLENLLLLGNANLDVTGNDSNNRITGNSGNNTLDGGTGNDTLAGGAGNDTYLVDSGDVLTEAANEGVDTIRAGFSAILGANFEHLILTGATNLSGQGNALNNALMGNDGDNILRGGAGNDTLDGGPGQDVLEGGTGDDTYVIDAVDTIVELPNEGTDSILSATSYVLSPGAHLENITLTGTADNDATGNELANRLQGNAGVNHLIGGPGNDTYVYDDPNDILVEDAQGGMDTIEAHFALILPVHFENLVLYAGDYVVGNRSDNTITGNAGDNILDGGRGWDALAGGGGNDTYRVDQQGDKVTEAANAGTDEVHAQVSYALGANLENLILGDSAGNLDGTGNALNNLLTGNAGSNTLDGGDGNDTLFGLGGDDVLKGGAGNDELAGGLGADLLMGGAGNDRFVFDTNPGVGGNADVIVDFVKGQDKLVFSVAHYAGLDNLADAFRAGVGVVAVDTDDRLLYDSAGGDLYYDPDGTGFDPALLIASLTGHPALAVADIQLL